ncbi:MAG: Maf family protein, partial [Bacilli bacterium]
HSVLSSVAILDGEKTEIMTERVLVTFFPLSESEIQKYVETGESMDKAGAYGIQGFGAYLVKHINGDYNAVVGMPYARVARCLSRCGVKTRYN